MPLDPGTRLGHFDIIAPLGAGGMGEVYRARDSRLERDVAIKVLPSADPDLKARFAREARIVAGLKHPHICTLHDVGEEHGTAYLVMEYLDGETLAGRLARGPMDLQEVMRRGVEIAQALDAAHGAGIVHRDLKPANIMLTRGGVKLLDFGVARLRAPAVAAGSLRTTAGDTPPLTGRGVIIGTPQYMALEQLEGQEADARSDLFALGAILYEMVTGRPAFTGSSPASLVAAILTTEPPAAAPLDLPPTPLGHLVRTCLTKDPAERRQTAHDLLLELQWIAAHSSSPPALERPVRRRLAWTGVAAALGGLGIVAGAAAYYGSATPAQRLNVSIMPPGERAASFPALSPDGTRIAFVARDQAGKYLLWIRPLESSSSTAVAIPGTENAFSPFWSPDSRSIGFFASGKLKTVSASLSPVAPSVQTLADAPAGRGGTWSPSGVIVFASNIEVGLQQVSTMGRSEVTPATTLSLERGENSHRWPQFLPDGRRILYLARSASADHQGIYVGTPGANDWKLLLRAPNNAEITRDRPKSLPALFPRSGQPFLLFVRGQTLTAQRVDLDRLELTGEPVTVADPVGTWMNRGNFSAAETALIYRSTVDQVRLGLFNRSSGEVEQGFAETGSYPKLSPDGTQVVWDKVDPATGAGDIWVADISRRQSRRLTFDGAYEWTPLWSPDGREVAFATNRHGAMDLYAKAADGAGAERELFRSDRRKLPTDWSRDGKFLLFQQEEPGAGWDLWALPLGSREPFSIQRTPFNELHGAFSPDERWIAFTSDDSGQEQVYVRAFDPASPSSAESARKDLVSVDGGSQPRWATGNELFYRTGNGKIAAVKIGAGPTFVPGKITELFDATFTTQSGSVAAYDVTRDGLRFVMRTRDDDIPAAPYTLLVNWASPAAR